MRWPCGQDIWCKGSYREIVPRSIFADLSGLPPLIIQVGTHEVLLDEGAAALDRAGQFLSAHLALAGLVTA